MNVHSKDQTGIKRISTAFLIRRLMRHSCDTGLQALSHEHRISPRTERVSFLASVDICRKCVSCRLILDAHHQIICGEMHFRRISTVAKNQHSFLIRIGSVRKFGCPCARDNQTSRRTTKNTDVVVRRTTINFHAPAVKLYPICLVPSIRTTRNCNLVVRGTTIYFSLIRTLRMCTETYFLEVVRPQRYTHNLGPLGTFAVNYSIFYGSQIPFCHVSNNHTSIAKSSEDMEKALRLLVLHNFHIKSHRKSQSQFRRLALQKSLRKILTTNYHYNLVSYTSIQILRMPDVLSYQFYNKSICILIRYLTI